MADVQLIPIDDEEMPQINESTRVPTWGEENPNLWAAANTALDLVPLAASGIRKSRIGIPVAGALNTLGQAAKREINDQPQDGVKSVMDFVVGAAGQGIGDTISKGVRVAGELIPKAKELSQMLYKSAIKPKTGMSLAERNAAASRGLDEGITLDAAGFQRLKDNINVDSSAVNRAIMSDASRGGTIPVQSVVNEFNTGGNNALSNLANQLKGHANLDDVLLSRQNVLRADGPDIPIDRAQALKQHYQNQASYPNDTRGLYDEQIDQATARGFRKAIETRLPEVIEPNARNAERSILAEQLRDSTLGRVDNRDPLGLQMAVASVDLSNPMAQANFVARTVQNFPKVQAKMAIKLYEGATGKKLPVHKYREAVRYLAQGELTRRANELTNPRNQFDEALGLNYASEY